MDQHFSIPGMNGAQIYGVFNQANSGRAPRLLILSHGLTGKTTEFIHVMAVRHFNAAGYDVARISYYGGAPDQDRLFDSTIDRQAKMLNLFVDHFRPAYPKICVAGHSYGGLTLLVANPDVTAASFWDSTFQPAWQNETTFVPELNAYAINWGQGQIVSEAVVNEAKQFATRPATSFAQQFKAPAQINITTGQDKPGRNRRALYDAFPESQKTELNLIEGADHQFTNGKTAEELYAHTQRWFDKFTL